MKTMKVKKGNVLILRTNNKNNQSHGGFQYPEEGWVEAPDWKATEACGNGLHGALKGCGDGSLFNWDTDAKWMVLEVEEKGIIDLNGKVKFKGGTVVYCGDRKTATDIIASVYGHIGIIGATVTGGYGATVTGGNRATVTGGDWTTVTGGDEATVTGGRGATVTGGDGATVTGGSWTTVTGGDEATVTGGDGATVTGGYRATVTGGYRAILLLKHWDGSRYRIITAYVGEDGIEENVAYMLDNDGKFVKKD